ncbi:MAG: hypothetical protein WCF65_03515, partial [Parachlamydiaceae bacterium]
KSSRFSSLASRPSRSKIKSLNIHKKRLLKSSETWMFLCVPHVSLLDKKMHLRKCFVVFDGEGYLYVQGTFVQEVE